MTIHTETDYKTIGLAAAGAAMLGMSLEEALTTSPTQLAARITALNIPTSPASPAPAETPEPTPPPAAARGILARAAAFTAAAVQASN